MRVRVYFNLQKKLFSVVDTKTGRVVDHVSNLTLSNVRFTVRESGRQRVIKERRKNVHAFVVGDWFRFPADTQEMVRDVHLVSYNPYKGPHFYDVLSGDAVHAADYVSMGVNVEQKPTTITFRRFQDGN